MKRHLFRRMGRFLRPQASSLAGAAALAALSGLLALLVPLVAGWAAEAIGTGPGAADLTAVLRYCAAGLGAAVLSAVCSYGASAALVLSLIHIWLWSRWRFFCHASSNLKMVFSIWNGV